jgi:hypothetical protein
MDVRRHEGPDIEWMLDDGQPSARVSAIDLEDDADSRNEAAASPLSRLDDLGARSDRRRRVVCHHRDLLT